MPRKNSKYLTDPGIGKMNRAPAGKRIERFDAGAPGLALRINGKGLKTWTVHVRLHGKQKRITLGDWPAMGVAEARDRAREAKAWVKAGIDPATVKAAEQESAEAAVEAEAQRTFGVIAERYITRECQSRDKDGGRRLTRGREIEALIRRELLPVWSDKPMEKIRKRDVIAVTDALVDAGKPAAANKVHEFAGRIFRWAHTRDEIDINPIAGMVVPTPKVRRQRALSEAEIKAVWEAADDLGYPFGRFVQLLLLTGQRRTEVSEMRWREIDLGKREWSIPAERTKSNRKHIVPLADMALALLEALPRFENEDGEDFVFTTTASRRPIADHNRTKARLDEACGFTDWRLHDLRRSVRTHMTRLGVADVVAQRVLNHAPRGMDAIYNVYQYLDERRDALERWAREVENIVTPPPENVVKLAGAR